MTTPAQPSRQGRAYDEDEVQQLLREALTEQMADGTPFRDISVARLIAHAGIARSTFYKYFDDKSGMLQALSAATLRRLYVAQREWLGKGRETTPDDVREGMLALLEAYRRDAVVLRAVAEASVYDPSIGEAYTSAVRDYARAIERFVRRGRKEGWIADAVAPADTGEALAWMTERTVSQVAGNASRHRIESLAATLARIVSIALLDGASPDDAGGGRPAP